MTRDKKAFDFDKLIILDLGNKYNQVLTRTIREMHVYSELLPHTTTAEELKAINAKGIILSGGSLSQLEETEFAVDPAIFDLGIPVLGIDYGMQAIAEHFGGDVTPARTTEYEHVSIKVTDQKADLFTGLDAQETVWMNTQIKINTLPDGFVVSAVNVNKSPVAFEHTHLRGVQFHPEAEGTEHGITLLKNFVFHTCEMSESWNMQTFIDNQVQSIRETVGDKKVLLALSGGVDSSVVGVLLNKAIGDQLTCIFVDHGLLRKDEVSQVMESLEGKFGLNIIQIDAKDRFLTKLKGVSDPEEKRKIIGNEFIYVFNDEAEKLEGIDFLAQGTLYTDIIESGTASSQVVKSHHNVGGLPEDMSFELIEPVNILFKDEVRELGIALNMPEELVWRQPFPGPGLGIRIIGDITEDKLDIVRESDAILREEIKKAGLDRDIWQYFTVLPGIKSVGVRDGARTYDHTVGIRAVHSVDGLTVDFAHIPWDVLQHISQRIVNEVDHVNRIVYDITSKPPATVEWE